MKTEKVEVLRRQELLGHEFTIYGTSDEPLFLAKDVAELIEHTNSRVMLQSVDEEEKGVRKVYTLGGEQEMWFLTEDGLYEVLMRSNKPIAKEFKKGVKTILKEIRKNGAYVADNGTDSEDEMIAKALLAVERRLKIREERIAELEEQNQHSALSLKAKEEEIERKKQVIDVQDMRIKLQDHELKASAPKVQYYEEVLQSTSTLTTTQVAKSIGMEANALNKKLKEIGIQYKQSGQWMLCSPYSTWGLHSTRTQSWTTSVGTTQSKTYSVWTHKGMRFIHALSKCDWNIRRAVQHINGEQQVEQGKQQMFIAQEGID